MNKVISPQHIAEQLTALWSPRVVAAFDDYYLKVAKIHGEFGWHSHDDEDELFMVMQGTLRIEMQDRRVSLNSGDVFVVPKGVKHNPIAEHECLIILVERNTTLHTGSEITDKTRSLAEQLGKF
jgi:mannose-6-phosphate isomerase-like protein (cupin superfamily)